MQRPTVIFMNRVYPPVRGASGRMLRDLARAFAKEGWQVTVITTGSKKVVERDGAVRVIRLKAAEKPRGLLGYLWIWARMAIEALRLPGTHLIVTMTDPPLLAVAGQMVSLFKDARHIHWCQDLYPDVLPSLGYKVPDWLMTLFYKLSRKAMREADKTIVVGRCMARHLSCDGFDPKQITVIPNWPDFELVRPEAEYKPEPVQKMPVLSEAAEAIYREHADQVKYGPKFRVLYAGNIGRAHPIDAIVGAAEMLCEEQSDIEFVFVGDGPAYDRIAYERSQRHLDNIRLLPYQPLNRLKDLMESGDVHLISMNEDAAGMIVPSKLYSAMAAQRPCIMIGPTQSEAAKVIMDYEAGSVVSQRDAKALAEEIRQMRFDSDKWFRAHEGAIKASQVFLPAESINAWIERAWAVVEPDLRN